MKYFTFKEFERSEIAARKHINNSIPFHLRANITALVDNVLDPLREAWGGPIDISSGYRCPALNKAAGGVSTSQHMTGEAADLRIYKRDAAGKLIKDANGNAIVDKIANRQLFQRIQELKLPFDQLIDEKDFSWVHVSHRANGRQRKEVKRL